METWRKELYKSYSTNKKGRNISLDNNCYFFKYQILKQLPKDKNCLILDLGAGHGDLLHCLSKAGYKNNFGVDISREEVKIAKERGIFNISEENIFAFLEKTISSYDVIFMMDILEHLNRTEYFNILNLVNKKLKKGGTLIAQVPNATGLFGMRIRYGDITHETCFTHNSIIQSLTLANFKEIKTYELSPVKKEIKGFVRNFAWHLLVLPFRLILILETGIKTHILSQNMLIKAIKRL